MLSAASVKAGSLEALAARSTNVTNVSYGESAFGPRRVSIAVRGILFDFNGCGRSDPSLRFHQWSVLAYLFLLFSDAGPVLPGPGAGRTRVKPPEDKARASLPMSLVRLAVFSNVYPIGSP